MNERTVRRALFLASLAGLAAGLVAWVSGRGDLAKWCWAIGTIPVVVGLFVSMVRNLLAERLGVDAVAFMSMSGALILGENLAGVVVAIMYSGGNLLEDFAVARAEDRSRTGSKVAHRRIAAIIEDVLIE